MSFAPSHTQTIECQGTDEAVFPEPPNDLETAIHCLRANARKHDPDVNRPAQFMTVEGAGHCLAGISNPPEVMTAMPALFVKYLKGL